MEEDSGTRRLSILLMTLITNVSKRQNKKGNLAPIVASCIGKYVAALVNVAFCDLFLHRLGVLQLGTRIFVPEHVSSVTSDSRQGVMQGMEADVVDLKKKWVWCIKNDQTG